MENNQPNLQEKTTAMREAIRMAKEVHENARKPTNYQVGDYIPPEQYNSTDTILTTAKQIYDWLLTT